MRGINVTDVEPENNGVYPTQLILSTKENYIMKVVILCGGKGTRLLPVVSDRPKVLADVDEKPFLYYLLKKVWKERFKDVILCVGHGADKVKDYVREWSESVSGPESGSALNISFSEDMDLGTGGALKKAEDLIGEDLCIVMNGDTWCDINLRILVRIQNKIPSSPLICRCHCIDAGIYVLPKGILQKIPEGESDLDDVLWDYSFPVTYEVDSFIDMGTPEGYTQIKEVLRK